MLEQSSHKIFPSGIFHQGLGKGVLPALRAVADLCPALTGNILHGGRKRMKPILLTLGQEDATGRQRTQPKKCSWRCSRLPLEHRMRHLACGSYLTLPTTQEWTSPEDNKALPPLLELCMAGRKAATVSQELLQQESRRELPEGTAKKKKLFFHAVPNCRLKPLVTESGAGKGTHVKKPEKVPEELTRQMQSNCKYRFCTG